MALNIQTFKTRTLTAAVFVVVMLAGLFINQWSFFLLFSVIHFGCWKEYQKLMGLIDVKYLQITSLHKYGILLLGWAFMLFMTNNSYHIGHTTLYGVGFMLLMITAILLMAFEIVFPKSLNLKTISYSLLGLLYISLSCGLMMDLYDKNFRSDDTYIVLAGASIPMFIIACMWINDTMAYMVGSFIGKTPFSKISPKKTWEGTVGGAVLCVVVVGLLAQYCFFKNYNIAAHHWYIIAAIAAVTGTAGDLLESKIKRVAGVKDSGEIMPGHGGFLDRFDSLLVAVPFVWLYLKLFV
jgi:phosphatidate cytidylyltransferase